MHLKSPLAIAESDNATQKVTNNFEKDIISRQYAHLIDKRIGLIDIGPLHYKKKEKRLD